MEKGMHQGRGILYAVGAYTLWGVLPLYWKLLRSVPAYEILCHRILWSFVFLVFVLSLKKNWSWIRTKLKERKTVRVFLVTSFLIGFNWFVYIWAVNSGYLLECSLGYFINPLVNVLLGVLILHEKIRPGQAAAILFAVAGVIHLTINYGSFPWIGLALALSFGFYGLLRKTGALNSIQGLTFETSVLFFPALFFLLMLHGRGAGAFGQVPWRHTLLLAFSGVVTAFPLLLFAAGARRIPLSTIGILQYISPSFQFFIGLFIFKEDFSTARLIGFILIWIALLIYTAEGIFKARRTSQLKKA
jgi:chloramphenicol-sensitive protein RarD